MQAYVISESILLYLQSGIDRECRWQPGVSLSDLAMAGATLPKVLKAGLIAMPTYLYFLLWDAFFSS